MLVNQSLPNIPSRNTSSPQGLAASVFDQLAIALRHGRQVPTVAC